MKNGAGGIRDLDVVWWALKARFGFGELRELARRVGILVQRAKPSMIEAASEVLWRDAQHPPCARRPAEPIGSRSTSRRR